jgi:hypothetical protein
MSRHGVDALPVRTLENERRNSEIRLAQYHKDINEGRGIPGTPVPAPILRCYGFGKYGPMVYGRQMVVYMAPLDANNDNPLLANVSNEHISKYSNARFDDREIIDAFVNSCRLLDLTSFTNAMTVYTGYDYENHTITLNRNGLVGFSESTDWKRILKQAHGAIGKPKKFAIFATYPNYLNDGESIN